MRNPKRIDTITNLVKCIWKKHPNFRLTQLIANCFPPGDLYYCEDKELEQRLKKTYKKDLK